MLPGFTHLTSERSVRPDAGRIKGRRDGLRSSQGIVPVRYQTMYGRMIHAQDMVAA